MLALNAECARAALTPDGGVPRVQNARFGDGSGESAGRFDGRLSVRREQSVRPLVPQEGVAVGALPGSWPGDVGCGLLTGCNCALMMCVPDPGEGLRRDLA
jgi:hypothetical protein